MLRHGHHRCGLVLLAAACAAGCAGGGAASALATPPRFEPVGQTKCSIAASQSRPLIVEWPAADRGDLEALSRRGLVAVRYTGCELVVMRQCTLAGRYGYTAFTKKDDRVVVRDEDELYANLPLGAVKLEGVLAKTGELDVRMSIVGKYEAPPPEAPACPGATHFVSGMTVGAFEMVAGGHGAVGAGVAVGGIGAGARSTADRELLNRDGDPAACASASSRDTVPPDGCGAILRLELQPLASGSTSGPTTEVPKPLAPGPVGAAPRVRLASSPVIGSSPAVKLEALTRDSEGGLWYGERAAGWRWRRLDAPAGTEPALLLRTTGRSAPMAVVRGERGEVARAWLDGARWQPIDGARVSGTVAAMPTRDGKPWLTVACDDAGGLWRTDADGAQPTWRRLAGDAVGVPTVAANADGTLEVLVARSDGRLWHLRQRQPDGAFGDWEPLGGPVTEGRPSVVRGDKGHLTVFARDGQGKLQHAWQWAPGGKWSAWLSLGGELGGNPVALKASDGRMVVLARFRDGSLRMLEQQAAYGPWGEWRDLGVSTAGDPAAALTSQGIVVLRADGEGTLWESIGQSAGGSFGPWTRVALGEPRSS